MAFTKGPISAVITDANGNEINLGQGSGPFTAGPTSIVITDKNGNAVTVGAGGGGATSFTGDSVLLNNSGSTGAVTATTANRTANTVYAGPVSGAAAAGSMRALVPADIPTLYTMSGFPSLKGFSVVNVPLAALAATDNDLYTVPAGKRAIVAGFSYNSSVSTVTIFPQIKIAGTYYRVGGNVGVLTVANSLLHAGGFIMEAGDIFSLNATATGVTVALVVYLFDDTSAWKTARITTFINGDNTIYTTPVGKTAYLAAAAAFGVWTTGVTAAGPNVFNLTGGAVSYSWNLVPSGGSVAAGNKMGQNLTVSANANAGLGTVAAPFSMATGDFLSVNSGSNGKQLGFLTVFEF